MTKTGEDTHQLRALLSVMKGISSSLTSLDKTFKQKKSKKKPKYKYVLKVIEGSYEANSICSLLYYVFKHRAHHLMHDKSWRD